MHPPAQDEIVPIPPSRLRYFGGPGRMLLPSPATVAAVIGTVPAGRLLTTAGLRARLAQQFGVEGVCPVTTVKALQTIAHDPHSAVPYWRVVNQNGGLIARFPGGVREHARRLRQERFRITTLGPVPRVKDFEASLVRPG